MGMSNNTLPGIERRTFLKTAAAGSAISIAGCLGDDESNGELSDTIAVGATSPVYPVFYYPLFPVLEERLAENHGVELVTETFAGPTAMTGGFMQGEIDVGYLTPAAITNQRNEGVPVVAIGTVVHQFYHSLVVDPSIDDWDDLEGADVAVHEPLTSSTVLTEAMIAEELGSVDAVEYQNILGTTERMASLEAGEVDAIIAFLSGAFQAEADGYGEILGFPWEYDHLADIPANGWVLPEPDLDDNEEQMEILMTEMQAAYDEVYEEDSEDIVDRALDTDVGYPEFGEDVWIDAFETAVENDLWPRDYETNMSEERMEESIDLSVELDLLDEDDRISAGEILDDRFVGEI